MDAIKRVWNRMPQQIRHLLVPVVVIIVGYLVIRSLLVPAGFGQYGHYRGPSLVENASKEIKYAGSEACLECHDTIVAEKKGGYHRGVACETCHGPVMAHTQDPEKVKPQIPKGRNHCLLCHEYLSARPTGFPQVVSDSHNPVKPCISCHQPHNPKPPNVPKGCDACHAKIQRTIALSRHSNLECTKCHEVPKEHKVNPRENRPKRLQSRDTCGACHAQDSTAPKEVPRVNMASHGEKYLCWQCHYPHQPEAR
jgi:hypothetical protein